MHDTIKAASEIIGTWQLSLAQIHEGQVMKKPLEILASPEHDLSEEVGRRYRLQRAKRNKSAFSFIPTAIKMIDLLILLMGT